MKENGPAGIEPPLESVSKRKDGSGTRARTADQPTGWLIEPTVHLHGDAQSVDPYEINPVAPYQAVPYGGSITQHLTTPLPVLEPEQDAANEKVHASIYSGLRGCRSADRSLSILFRI